jgi:hypothetical protein
MEIAVVNVFLCSLTTTLENSLDDTEQVCQFVGNPSAESCSKRIFPTRVTRSLILNSRGTVKKAPLVLIKQPAKQGLCLVPATPPCACQAQGFSIKTTKQNK